MYGDGIHLIVDHNKGVVIRLQTGTQPHYL